MGILEPNKVQGVLIHCAATKSTMNVDRDTINRWHIKRGFSEIGYHYYITFDGIVHKGRDTRTVGAHCKGKNSTHLGICLEGGLSADNKPENNFTDEQWFSLIGLLKELPSKFPNIKEIAGHNKYAAKACPSFDVEAWKKKFNINY